MADGESEDATASQLTGVVAARGPRNFCPLLKGEPMVQVNRPVSKLVALLPGGRAMPTFGELDHNRSRPSRAA